MNLCHMCVWEWAYDCIPVRHFSNELHACLQAAVRCATMTMDSLATLLATHTLGITTALTHVVGDHVPSDHAPTQAMSCFKFVQCRRLTCQSKQMCCECASGWRMDCHASGYLIVCARGYGRQRCCPQKWSPDPLLAAPTERTGTTDCRS